MAKVTSFGIGAHTFQEASVETVPESIRESAPTRVHILDSSTFFGPLSSFMRMLQREFGIDRDVTLDFESMSLSVPINMSFASTSLSLAHIYAISTTMSESGPDSNAAPVLVASLIVGPTNFVRKYNELVHTFQSKRFLQISSSSSFKNFGSMQTGPNTTSRKQTKPFSRKPSAIPSGQSKRMRKSSKSSSNESQMALDGDSHGLNVIENAEGENNEDEQRSDDGRASVKSDGSGSSASSAWSHFAAHDSSSVAVMSDGEGVGSLDDSTTSISRRSPFSPSPHRFGSTRLGLTSSSSGVFNGNSSVGASSSRAGGILPNSSANSPLHSSAHLQPTHNPLHPPHHTVGSMHSLASTSHIQQTHYQSHYILSGSSASSSSAASPLSPKLLMRNSRIPPRPSNQSKIQHNQTTPNDPMYRMFGDTELLSVSAGGSLPSSPSSSHASISLPHRSLSPSKLVSTGPISSIGGFPPPTGFAPLQTFSRKRPRAEPSADMSVADSDEESTGDWNHKKKVDTLTPQEGD